MPRALIKLDQIQSMLERVCHRLDAHEEALLSLATKGDLDAVRKGLKLPSLAQVVILLTLLVQLAAQIGGWKLVVPSAQAKAADNASGGQGARD